MPSTVAEERPFPWVGLVALAVASFSIVTVEVLPTGLLPEIASSFGSTEAVVGLLVSLFAFSVVFFSAPLTRLTQTMPRKQVVLMGLSVVVLAGFLAAAAPVYSVLVVARILGGAGHGLYWSVVNAYPAYLVGPRRLGTAIAIVSVGGSLASVAGLPVGTLLGQMLGWRAAFAILTAVAGAALLLMARYLPPVRTGRESSKWAGSRLLPHDGRGATARETELQVSPAVSLCTAPVPVVTSSVPLLPGMRSNPLGGVASEDRHDHTLVPSLLILVSLCLYLLGYFSFSTYIAPFVTDGMGLPSAALSPILAGQGILGLVSVIISGWLFASRPRLWMGVLLIVQVALFALMGVTEASVPLTITWILTIGLVGGAIPMLSQTLLLRTVSMRLRDMMLSFHTVAFNTGIGAGAAVGSFVLEHTGVHATPFVAFLLSAVGGAVFLVSFRRRPRGQD